jgi:hypothetical protein
MITLEALFRFICRKASSRASNSSYDLHKDHADIDTDFDLFVDTDTDTDMDKV